MSAERGRGTRGGGRHKAPGTPPRAFSGGPEAEGADLRPLNRARDFEPWPPLDPGRFLDMNPSLVTLASGEPWVVFCRYPVPPQPGLGSIWAVRVDAALRPVGRPIVLVGEGIDPRVVALGERVLVFYARLERNAEAIIDGSCMALAEFAVAGEAWTCSSAFTLPKFPLSGERSAEAQDGWEKNWVPFPVDADRVGLIYAHEPWDVITLDVGEGRAPRLLDAHRSPGLVWDYGTIRGGTPPVPYDAGRLVTFFHAAQVVGSRRVYTVGACVFGAAPPHAPELLTVEPLLVAPYGRGAHRFGWGFAGSVVFPAGARAEPDGFCVVSGLDDGEIATFRIGRSELAARLAPPAAAAAVALRPARGGEELRLPLPGLVARPEDLAAPDDTAMIAFARLLVQRGRTLVDIGAEVGGFSMALAPRYDRVLAFEADAMLRGWFERNRVLNGYAHVACRDGLPGEGGLPPLDPGDLGAVDLVRLELPDESLPGLDGLLAVLAACRPVVLCRTGASSAIRPALAGVLARVGYGVEAIFPLAPAWILCRPGERSDLAWFV